MANTLFQWHKRRLYTWTSPDGQYHSQIDYILFSYRWRSFIESAKTKLGADYGSDHELLVSKFRLKLKKVGNTTRPFRYDLNQIPHDYIVEVMKKFKGLDLIDSALRTMNGVLWHCTGGSDQSHPQEKKFKKAKWLSEKALQIAEKRREVKGKREKENSEYRVLKNKKER